MSRRTIQSAWLLLPAFLPLLAGCPGAPVNPAPVVPVPPQPQANVASKDEGIGPAVPDRQLDDIEAQMLEDALAEKPDDLTARVNLLWHYRGRFGDAAAERAGNLHVLWLIERVPQARVLGTPAAQIGRVPDRSVFDAVAALWRRQVDNAPLDAPVLAHAARFVIEDDPALATQWLQRALAVRPQPPAWWELLGDAHAAQQRAAVAPPLARSHAEAAIKAYRQAAAQSPSDRQKLHALTKLVKAASATEMDEATLSAGRQALELSSTFGDDADARVAAHDIRMLLARRRPGEADADNHFSAAIAIVRTGAIAVHQLDLRTVEVYVSKDRKALALEYLRAAEKAQFSREVKQWVRQIEAGQLPSWDAYLR